MVNKRWSKKAYESLKDIVDFYDENPEYGRKVVAKIIEQIDEVKYPEQYQEDEIIGLPYRRIMMKNYRIIYKVVSPQDIEILQIFDNRKSPHEIKKEFKK
jgi:addiction module RelE/StbE family toxin